jgi:Kef-type K+ transport system membrane component KefB
VNLILILVLGGLMQAVRSFTIAGGNDSGGTSLAFGYLLLTAYFAGNLFKQVGLPRLTGYLATGIVVGPNGLGLLAASMVDSLTLVNGMAVAMIALTAGNELEFRAMRPLMRSIAWITAIAVLGTTVLLAAAAFLTRGQLPFFDGLGTAEAVAVAAVLGVVMVAQSPAVVVALREETKSDGPVTRTVLGVVVIADLVVILLFAIVSSVCKAVLGGRADVLHTLGALAWELPGSLLVGAVLGLVLWLYLRRVGTGASLFLLLLTFVMAEVGQRLHFDPLLVALAAGMVIRNATKVSDGLNRHIEACSPPVFILFFAVAPATIHLDALALVGLPAAIFVLVRATGFLAGAPIGAKLAGAPETVRRFAGFGLLPQAGLALALSQIFRKTFPEFGEHAGALTLGVVAINELVAPVLYRLALVKSGEAGRRAASPEPQPAAVAPPLSAE